MVKIVFFILILAGIIIYPIIEMNNYKEKKNINVKSYVPTLLKSGRYFLYKGKLVKEGNFSVLRVYSKKKLEAEKFSLKDLENSTLLTSKKIMYTSPFLKGEEVDYFTKDYNLTTAFAVYNDNTKVINGGRFKLLGNSYKGFGENFKVDGKNNIYASNIKYFLKVK